MPKRRRTQRQHRDRPVKELLVANDLTPEKRRLVRCIQGRNEDLIGERILHSNKHAKRKQNDWLWEQAIMKCGGEGDPGAASRAARLIHGAGDLQRVQQDPHVQASLWNASVKVQKTVVEGINQHLQI